MSNSIKIAAVTRNEPGKMVPNIYDAPFEVGKELEANAEIYQSRRTRKSSLPTRADSSDSCRLLALSPEASDSQMLRFDSARERD